MTQALGALVLLHACARADDRPVESHRAAAANALQLARAGDPLSSAFRPVADGWRAEHGTFAIDANRTGFTVTAATRASSPEARIHVATRSLARGGVTLAGDAARAAIDGDGRFVIERGDVRESIESTPGGAEQRWDFAERPEGHGDVEFSVDVDGVRYVDSSRSGLRFRDGAHGAMFRYGHATWIDARGSRTPIEARWSEGHIAMRVPSEVVDHSVYPATLDPIVSPEFAFDSPVYGGPDPALDERVSVAAGPGNFLAAWIDGSNVVAARIDASGNVLDPGGLALGRYYRDARVIVTFDGTNWIVLWDDGYEVHAARIGLDGRVLDTGATPLLDPSTMFRNAAIASHAGVSLVTFQDSDHVFAARYDSTLTPIDTTPLALTPAGSAMTPAVTWDGTQWLVAWRTFDGTLHAQRISSSGSLLAPSITVAPGHPSPVPLALDSDGSTSLLAWFDLTASTVDVYAARIAPSGAVLDAPIPVAVGPGSRAFLTIGHDASAWLVGWHANSDNNEFVRVSAAGTLLDSPPRIFASPGEYPSLAFDGANGLLVWTTFLGGGGALDVVGTRIADVSVAPLDTPPFVVSGLANGEWGPTAAFDGENWLVVWADVRTPSGRFVSAARVSRSGTVIDSSVIAITASATLTGLPTVAFDGTEWFVTWADTRNGNSDIYAARVSRDGSLLDPDGIAVYAGAGNQTPLQVSFADDAGLLGWKDGTNFRCSRIGRDGARLDVISSPFTAWTNAQDGGVAFDGTNWLAVWSAGGSIYAVRISPSGAVLDPTPILVEGATAALHPSVVFDGESWFVAWGDGTSISGRRISATGVLVGSASTPVASSTALDPMLAFDGRTPIVSWSNYDAGVYGLVGTRIDANGSPLDPGGVSFATSADTLTPAGLAAGRDGTMLLTYERYDSVLRSERAVARTVRFDTLGTPCATDTDCASHFCVDGVCCENDCGGGASDDCRACSRARGAAVDGQCGVVRAATTCRPVSGSCDVAEVCDGASDACPSDGFVSASMLCRAANGVCDVPESCDGASANCPADRFLDTSVTCRVSAGDCDVAETCDGASATCPTDRFASPDTLCRDAAGPCDLAERCTGVDAVCPADALAANETVCRMPAGVCDREERCSGTSTECPVDSLRPDGANCSDETLCNGTETCLAGACIAGTALDCDDGDSCTTDRCDAAGGCAHDAIAGCCHANGDCDDHDPCTDDRCDANRCVFAARSDCAVDAGGMTDVADAGPSDVATTDASSGDAGDTMNSDARDVSTPDAQDGARIIDGGHIGGSSSCACRAPGGATEGNAERWVFLLTALALESARKRRRRVGQLRCDSTRA